MHVCLFVCIYPYMFVCMNVCLFFVYVCMYVFLMFIDMGVYICIMYVCTSVYVCTYSSFEKRKPACSASCLYQCRENEMLIMGQFSLCSFL
jgi:hypothetical protein